MLYSQRLSLVAWLKEWGLPLSLSLCTHGMLWAAHPPRQTPEFAYIFLVPVLAWLYSRPSTLKVFGCIIITGWIYQVAMVGWMRHVSFGGMCLATFLLSFYSSIWFLFAHSWINFFRKSTFAGRLLVITGLSALWVSIEWGRTLFTLGFPWCPLSVTQWERPVLLQGASVLGAWSVSFFLIFFNLSVCSYLHHLFIRRRQGKGFLNRTICPELYISLFLLFLMVYPFFINQKTNRIADKKILKVGICQPYLLDKWQEGNAVKHKQLLQKQSEFLSLAQPDIIIWPEASTPYPINLDRLWIEKLARKTGIPILAGSVIREEDASYNALVYVDPKKGINPEWYAKQILVPFGEYVPWPFKWIPGLEKLVGPVGNFIAGDQASTFEIPIRDRNSTTFVKAGLMICYEDIFPQLPKSIMNQGAELLIVSTNDAWFKEEGCAEQHAAHSVLRAAENNLPIIRCGNAGWSGIIDQNGIVRDVLVNDQNSIYFEGAAIFEVEVPFPHQTQSHSPLSNYFVYFCAFFSLAVAWYLNSFRQKVSLRQA